MQEPLSKLVLGIELRDALEIGALGEIHLGGAIPMLTEFFGLVTGWTILGDVAPNLVDWPNGAEVLCRAELGPE